MRRNFGKFDSPQVVWSIVFYNFFKSDDETFERRCVWSSVTTNCIRVLQEALNNLVLNLLFLTKNGFRSVRGNFLWCAAVQVNSYKAGLPRLASKRHRMTVSIQEILGTYCLKFFQYSNSCKINNVLKFLLFSANQFVTESDIWICFLKFPQQWQEKAKQYSQHLTMPRLKLYHFKGIVIAGMGFFTDAYDLYCITAVVNGVSR